VHDLDPARPCTAGACHVADHLAREEVQRRPVDVARDEVVALRRRDADAVLAQDERLAHGGDVGREREVCARAEGAKSAWPLLDDDESDGAAERERKGTYRRLGSTTRQR